MLVSASWRSTYLLANVGHQAAKRWNIARGELNSASARVLQSRELCFVLGFQRFEHQLWPTAEIEFDIPWLALVGDPDGVEQGAR